MCGHDGAFDGAHDEVGIGDIFEDAGLGDVEVFEGDPACDGVFCVDALDNGIVDGFGGEGRPCLVGVDEDGFSGQDSQDF